MATAARDKDDSVARVGYITHKIKQEDLKPGDHIYCYRGGVLYSHHGIYVGEPDCEVIHFSSMYIFDIARACFGMTQEAVKKAITDHAEQSRTRSSSRPPEIEIDFKTLHSRYAAVILELAKPVASTTLKEFCDGSAIRLAAYNCKNFLKTNQGHHAMKAMAPSETIKIAKYFKENPLQWKDYDLVSNNCETFACFCKTGLLNVAAQLHPTRTLVYELKKDPLTTADEAIKNYLQD